MPRRAKERYLVLSPAQTRATLANAVDLVTAAKHAHKHRQHHETGVYLEAIADVVFELLQREQAAARADVQAVTEKAARAGVKPAAPELPLSDNARPVTRWCRGCGKHAAKFGGPSLTRPGGEQWVCSSRKCGALTVYVNSEPQE